MKKIRGWRLFLFSMAGLGPNLLMTLVTGYLNDALLAPTGIDPSKTFTGSVIVSAVLCSVLFAIAKIIDGLIDIPLANLSDRLHTKFGKRRMGILIGWIPMVISFFFLWKPDMFLSAGNTGVTWIETLLLIIFYSSYTLTMVSYYGAFSTIVEDERARSRLSHFKAFFDTVQYCIAYALFPALLLKILGGTDINAISGAVLKLFPLMLTMLIPLFLIREDANAQQGVETNISLWKSLKLSLASKPFRSWLLTLLVMHMGLMLFLTGIGTTIPDGLMGVKGWKVTVMNSAAFAPVPLMLLLFNFAKKKRGVRFGLQTALLSFALSMFSFALAWQKIWGGGMMSFIIGLIASTIGSYGVGVFFSISYYFPSQIAANEIARDKRDHSSMYFAVQGLVTQVASAVGVSLIYMNLVKGNISLFGFEGGQLFLVPLIAGVLMLASFGCSFSMNKNVVDK